MDLNEDVRIHIADANFLWDLGLVVVFFVLLLFICYCFTDNCRFLLCDSYVLSTHSFMELGSYQCCIFSSNCVFAQIKDDTRRAVYCALIRLLQDNDLCVRVCHILLYKRTTFWICTSIRIFCILSSHSFTLCYTDYWSYFVSSFSWQHAGPCIFILKMQLLMRMSS